MLSGEKISKLPPAPSSTLADFFPSVQTGVTVKETLQQVLTLFNANMQLANISQVTGLNAQLATYLSLSGGTMAGALILNTSSPIAPLQAASKGYVDTVASGFTVILACQAATTANLNATQAGAGIGATLTNAGALAAFSVDGYSASLNDRILVKNQSLPQHNGIYALTTLGSGSVAWVLTRSADYDQATQIKPGTLVAVNNGTVNANTSWLQTATIVTVDTDPVLFSQFTFAPTNFLMVSNDLSDVASITASRANLGLGTAATKAASDNTKSTVAMVNGTTTAGHIAVYSDAAGTVQDGGALANLLFSSFCTGRLTLSSGVPVTVFDVTGATTVYFTPYGGNQISLYDGVSTWSTLPLPELSIAVPGTSNTTYDFFVYNNAGTPTPELQPWTNNLTRAVGLQTVDGIYSKSSDLTRRYVGSFSTGSVSGQVEDSHANRHVWNYYNRQARPIVIVEPTPSWSYNVNAYRQSNANVANQLDFLVGVVEETVSIQATSIVITNSATGRPCAVGIGIDSTTVNSSTRYDGNFATNLLGFIMNAYYNDFPTQGRHMYTWLEKGGGSSTQTWSGTGLSTGSSVVQTGIFGTVRG